MWIKVILILVFTGFCSLVCAAQKTDIKTTNQQRITLAKQSAIDNFEVEVQNIPYVEIRSFIRYQTASWLWQNGSDDTGYASSLSVKAFDESFEAENGIAESAVLPDTCSKILALLELHSPANKKKLVEKYRLDRNADLESALSSPGEKNNDKLIADKLIGAFQTGDDFPPQAGPLIDELTARNSPELPRVLRALISAAERENSSAESLFELIDTFRNPLVPEDLRNRFYLLSVKKGYEALGRDESDLNSAYSLIYAISDDISPASTSLFAQVNILRSALGAHIKQKDREYEEAFERIGKSKDKLEATISEAKAAENRTLKEDLYMDAVNLALKAEKADNLQIGLDLIESLMELRSSDNAKDSKNYDRWYDQCFSLIALQALKENNLEINKIAAGKINDKLTRAEILRKTAIYLFENKRFSSASELLKEALKITGETENNPRKIGVLLRFISTCQKVDKDQVFNLTLMAVKAMDSFSLPDIKDMPESERDKKYADSVLAIDTNLLSAFNELLKENRNGAVDFSNRINKKEFKVVTSYAFLTDNLGSLKKRLTEEKK
jgi:hypothetical protein